MAVRTVGRGTAWAFAGALLLTGMMQPGARALQSPAGPPSVAPAGAAPAPTAQAQMLRYVRAGESGAKALNLPDAQGVSLLEIPARGLLAVHGERSGWLEVESPGGFRVWVFGEFLKESSLPGMVEVTGNDVRMRPLPSSGTESYPLGQYLSKGERLRMITRNDAAKPLQSDWVQVYSPPGARAWVAAGETQPLESGVSGAALWSGAVQEAKSAQTGILGAAGADTPKVREALQSAEALLARERGSSEPDFAAVQKAYEDVLALEPAQATAKLARERVEEVQLLAEAYALKGDLSKELERREGELRRRQQAMEEASKRGVFDGRYDVRGWLEKRQVAGEAEPTYVLRWAGGQLAELTCLSGRFDLSVFVGCELGISGRQLRTAVPASLGNASRAAQIDVARLEVIAAKPANR